MKSKDSTGRESGERNVVSRTALAIALATGGTMFAAPAIAQDSENEIVVTGSYIRGTPETASLPVDVITAQDLAEQGSPTVTELIRNLGASAGIDGNTNQFTSNGLEGLGNVNLRGLGPSRTLVLFNGHRMVNAPYGIGESAQAFVDTNLIPANAIGRIEVLKDGAAATYGSDAIAGVVNFITRRGFQGFEFGGDYRWIDGSDGEYSLNGLWGWESGDGNIDTLIAVGYQHRSTLSTLIATGRSVRLGRIRWAAGPPSPIRGATSTRPPARSSTIRFAQTAICRRQQWPAASAASNIRSSIT